MNDSDFFSVDKLVEFGLSVAISQQMVASMNQAIKGTIVPGAMNPMPTNATNELFYFAIDGKQAGPFTGRETIDLLQQRKLTKDTLSWKPGMNAWKKIEEVPEILKFVALTPPELPNSN
jgi:hypothetical protein